MNFIGQGRTDVVAIKNIRDEIVRTARKMFLENPYDEVAMRDIAQALGISVGNLTYHFNKKECLVEAVVLELFRRHQSSPPCHTLKELDAWITLSAEAGDKGVFYFKDFERLAQISQTVRDIQRQVFERNMSFWRETLTTLCQAGIMQPEGFAGQHDAFIHNFYLLKARWHEQSRIETLLGVRETGFRFRAWAAIYPMLTEAGRREFKEEAIISV